MNLNLTQNNLIGVGNTADVYDIGNNKVIKLFHTGFYSQNEIKREFHNTLLAVQAGLPAAKAYEIVTVENQAGIIYDKIPGETLLDILFKTGEVETHTLTLAVTHKKILNTTPPSIESYKKKIQYRISRSEKLPPKSKTRLFKILESFPDGDSFCHDDFHFSNILWDGKQAYVIDLMDICKGNRNLDIARTLYLIEFPRVSKDVPNWEKVPEMQKQAAEIYLREMGVTRKEINDYLIIAAAKTLTGLTDYQAEQRELTLQFLRSQGIPV